MRHALSSLPWRHAALAVSLGLSAWLAGCASPSSTPPPATSSAATAWWSGRMGLQILQADGHSSQQSFSASFELRGSPIQGQLDVFNPLGSQVAKLTWEPGTAALQQGDTLTHSESLASLVRRSLGTDIPIHALFAWLQGQDVQAEGWQVDLGQFSTGRITARRHTPLPQAQLRLVLQSPPTP